MTRLINFYLATLLTLLAEVDLLGQGNYDSRLELVSSFDSVNYLIDAKSVDKSKLIKLFSLNQITREDISIPKDFLASIDFYVINFSKAKCGEIEKGAECFLVKAMILPTDKKKATKELIPALLNQPIYEIKYWKKRDELKMKKI
jgi:hypothetical protein